MVVVWMWNPSDSSEMGQPVHWPCSSQAVSPCSSFECHFCLTSMKSDRHWKVRLKKKNWAGIVQKIVDNSSKWGRREHVGRCDWRIRRRINRSWRNKALPWGLHSCESLHEVNRVSLLRSYCYCKQEKMVPCKIFRKANAFKPRSIITTEEAFVPCKDIVILLNNRSKCSKDQYEGMIDFNFDLW